MTSLSAAWSQRCSSKRELTVLSTTTTQKSTSYVFLNGYTNEVNNHLDMYSEVLIGRDDISKDVITLSTCFSMFVDICVRQLSLQGATVELEVEFKFQRHSCKLSFLFPPLCQSAPESLLAGYMTVTLFSKEFICKCVAFFFRVAVECQPKQVVKIW